MVLARDARRQLTAPDIEPSSARDVDTDFSIGPSIALETPIFEQNQAQIEMANSTQLPCPACHQPFQLPGQHSR